MAGMFRPSIWFFIIIVFVFLPTNLFAQEETETPIAQAELTSNGRATIANLIVVLTDGDPFGITFTDPLIPANDARAAGTILYSIGVYGADFNPQFPILNYQTLQDIANDPDADYIAQMTFDDMVNPDNAVNFANSVCALAPVVPTPTPTATATATPVSSPPGIIISVPPIVFTNNSGGDMEIWKAQGLSLTVLTNNSFDDTNPSYSPDGLQIAFQSFRSSESGIYTMNEDGTNEGLIAANNALEPDWYPLGSDLVFARGSEIYRVNTVGTPSESQLTNHGVGEAHNPAISNDGNWIIYEHNGDLYIMDGTCTASCTSTLLLAGGTHAFPAWLPNGLQLAWSTNNDLYTATVDYSTNPPQLTLLTELIDANSLQIDTQPAWVSDGLSIIFESDRDGTTSLYQYTFDSGTAAFSTAQTFEVQANGVGTIDPILSDGGQSDVQQETPTPTASCASGQVTLVPVYPGVSNEASDMLAIAQGGGLLLHDGPTINVRRIAVIPWGSEITVDRWIEHPQTSTNNQLWYRVTQFTYETITYTFNGTWSTGSLQPLLNQAQDVWVNARMEDNFYIIGQSGLNNPCLTIVSEIGDLEMITFTYDRRAAAEYAIAYAYRNSIQNAEGGIAFPGDNRATRRTTVNMIPDVNGQSVPIPYLIEAPYADFRYNYIEHGVEGKTASAVFLSEALWMGGLPMTYNKDVLGIVDRDSRCATTLVPPADPSDNYGLAGWRHCDEEFGNSTAAWRLHQGIICYYSQPEGFDCRNQEPFLDLNIVLPSETHGAFLGSLALIDPTTRQPRVDIEEIAGDIYEDEDGNGFPNLDNSATANIFYTRFIETIPNIALVETGDYVFTDRATSSGHGYLVAGWGPVTSCDTAYDKVWSFEPVPVGQENVYGQLLTTYQVGLTPYVVDFPGSIDVRQTQRPRPRPFYCATYFDLDDSISQDVNDNLGFFKILNGSTIVLYAEQLYTSPEWEWSN